MTAAASTADVGAPARPAVLCGPAAVPENEADPGAESASAPALREEVESVFEYMPATLAGMLAVAGVITLMFWQLTPAPVLLGWLGAFGLLWLLRFSMLQRYRRATRSGTADWGAWLRIWNSTTLVSGALLGLTAWLFYGRGTGIQQTGLIILVYTYCIAAVPVLANQPRLFIGFASLCFVPMILRIASDGDVYSYQLAGELLLIVSLTTVLAGSQRQALQRVTALKLRADRLLLQLGVEMRAAEAARQAAEIANRAKTQFFAAASHDLRQPLHAMGLFAEALRQRTREPEVAQLVNSIN